MELAEAFADGEVSAEELQAGGDPAAFSDLEDRLYGEAEPRLSKLAFDATDAATWLASPTFNVYEAVCLAEDTTANPAKDAFPAPNLRGRPWGIICDEQKSVKVGWLLRDIFGNPFRPVAFDPAWRTSATVGVARQMYDSRDFSAMPILADALRDAGCDDPDILGHCLGDGPHVRGCWLVDTILGKV